RQLLEPRARLVDDEHRAEAHDRREHGAPERAPPATTARWGLERLLDRLHHLGRAREAAAGVPGEGAFDEAGHRAGEAAARGPLVDRLGAALELAVQDLDRAVGDEGQPPREQLVEHAAERVEIRAV